MGLLWPGPGLGSPNSTLLFLGLMVVLEDWFKLSSFPFLRFLVMSLDRSLILFKVPLGLSGGRLVARDGVPLAPVRLEVEDRVSLPRVDLGAWVEARLDRLFDRPFDNRSNTLEPEALLGSLTEADLANLSINEFLRV